MKHQKIKAVKDQKKPIKARKSDKINQFKTERYERKRRTAAQERTELCWN